MGLQEFLDHVNRGAPIEGGSNHHRFMHGAAQDALRIVAQINTGYRTPKEVRELLADLTGKPVDDSVTVFPPFYSEFGQGRPAMLDDMRGAGAGPRVIQHVHATLRVALEHAVREELLPRNVAKLVQVAQPPREEREPLTVEEAQTLLKAARHDRLHALYMATLLLGMRRSEALALRWSDVDTDEGVLTVRRTVHRVAGEGLVHLPTKTRKSTRTVPLPPAVTAALKQHRERQAVEADAGGWSDRELVFATPRGTAIDPRNFTRMFGELCDRAGVRRLRLHDLRHTCVTLLMQLGVPPRVVMEIVGHSTLDMTMRVYGHVSLDAQRSALGQLGDLLGHDEDED